jgi:hypothetical protein
MSSDGIRWEAATKGSQCEKCCGVSIGTRRLDAPSAVLEILLYFSKRVSTSLASVLAIFTLVSGVGSPYSRVRACNSSYACLGMPPIR